MPRNDPLYTRLSCTGSLSSSKKVAERLSTLISRSEKKTGGCRSLRMFKPFALGKGKENLPCLCLGGWKALVAVAGHVTPRSVGGVE